ILAWRRMVLGLGRRHVTLLHAAIELRLGGFAGNELIARDQQVAAQHVIKAALTFARLAMAGGAMRLQHAPRFGRQVFLAKSDTWAESKDRQGKATHAACWVLHDADLPESSGPIVDGLTQLYKQRLCNKRR